MKSIVSVSIGSSVRNHRAVIEVKGEKFDIQRIGTDGSIEKAIGLIKELDGNVAAFGMGGIDLYLNAGNKKYMIKDAKPLKNAAKISPIMDGTFVKNTLERKVIKYIEEKNIVSFKSKKVLMVCGLDRFGMAESLIQAGCQMTFGDAIFSLGWDFPMHSLKTLHLVAGIIAPIACRMPFEMIYPTGRKQEEKNYKFTNYFSENDIIAGDFLYIKKYMPDKMEGKIVITNTVTGDDINDLRKAGVSLLITTTPELNGRSFGTNVMEALLVAISAKKPNELSEDDYSRLIDEAGLTPRVEYFNEVYREVSTGVIF